MLMFENPYESPKESSAVPPTPRCAPKTVFEALWRGAKAGWKWTTYIVGPLALLMLVVVILGVVIKQWRGISEWNDFRMLGSPVGLYLSSCLWGIIIGTLGSAVRYGLGWRQQTVEGTDA